MTKISNLYSLTNYITANTSGNIVISAPSSGYALDVTGTGRFTGDLTATQIIVNDANGIPLRFQDISAAITGQTAGYIGMSTSAFSGNNGDLVLYPRTSATSKILLMGGNVGIGTTSPSSLLHLYTATARNIPALGAAGGHQIIQTGGVIATCIGVNANGNYWIQPQHINAGGSTVYSILLAPSGGNVGIGTTSPAKTLTVSASVAGEVAQIINSRNNGSGDFALVTSLGSNNNNTSNYHLICSTGGADKFYIYGNGTYQTVSDRRLKKNITNVTDTFLDKVLGLNIVNYNWSEQEDGHPLEFGMIAQEVEEVIPSIVHEGREQEDGNVYKGIQASVLPYILIKAIQELSAKVTALENK